MKYIIINATYEKKIYNTYLCKCLMHVGNKNDSKDASKTRFIYRLVYNKML